MRKIIIRFNSEEAMDRLSKKFFDGTDYKLLTNMDEVFLNDGGFSFKFKKTMKVKKKPEFEWQRHWKDMTYFNPELKKAFTIISLNFDDSYTNEVLAELLEQPISNKTKATFYPLNTAPSENLTRVLGDFSTPRHPIYIISKGRSDCCITADYLIKMGVEFRIVIEKSEWSDYSAYYDESLLLELDMSFKDSYNTYIEDFDETKSKGSGPVRNFVWHHAKNVLKSERHWIMDDNIYGFAYFLDQKRIKAADGTVFVAAEDFVDRYDNIGVAGLNYYMFAIPGFKDRPYVANTKVYSCLLIKNDIDVRWGGRYNEDVDLCIRSLKEGYSTIQFDSFLSKKGGTQLLGGGNTDAFYADEGTLPKSDMLAFEHPDISKVHWRFQRWHHTTNYDIFDHYKDRTIYDTIVEMSKKPLLDAVTHADVISEIRKIDFNTEVDWDVIKNVEVGLRESIIDTIKFYRFKKCPDSIIQKLTEQPLMNCDSQGYRWDEVLTEMPDNNLMLRLLELGNEVGLLTTTPDWDVVMGEMETNRKNKIIAELVRNKYLFKLVPFKRRDYNLKQFTMSDVEHSEYRDSKNYILNTRVNLDDKLEDPVTHLDKRHRGITKVTKQKDFKRNLTNRHTVSVVKERGHTVLITGCPKFDDKNIFNENVDKWLNSETSTIVNCVYHPSDLLAARYALSKKIKNKDFMPNEKMYGVKMYFEIYKEMFEVSDECIVFVDKMTDELEFLIKLFKDSDKPVKVVTNKAQTQSLEDW